MFGSQKKGPGSWFWLGQFNKESNFAKKIAKKLAK